MIFLYAFLIGGLICLIAQLLIDGCKLLPVHIVVLFVVLGAGLEIFNIYDKLIEFAGAGVLIPISSFGHSLTHSAVEAGIEKGYFGIFSGMFDMTASGISITIIFAFFISLMFRPRG